MITDLLTNCEKYFGKHPHFPTAFAWLKSFDFNTADGKYPILGDSLIAGVQRYTTKPAADKKWESHQRFGDIQVVFTGEELCGVGPLTSMVTTTPYDSVKDVEKYASPTQAPAYLHLKPSVFAVFFPEDAHQPGVSLERPTEVLKVVIKFRLKPGS